MPRRSSGARFADVEPVGEQISVLCCTIHPLLVSIRALGNRQHRPPSTCTAPQRCAIG
jgi:hypothetical protein